MFLRTTINEAVTMKIEIDKVLYSFRNHSSSSSHSFDPVVVYISFPINYLQIDEVIRIYNSSIFLKVVVLYYQCLCYALNIN